MSPVATNEKRVRAARRSLFGTRSHFTAAFARARGVRISPEFKGSRWISVAILMLLVIQMLTGILLSLHYYPEPGTAYASTRAILGEVTAGWLVRAVHRWAGDLLLGAVIVHVSIVFFRRAYARPRHLQWVFAFFLLQATLGFRFTGRLLPWDGLGLDAAVRGLDLLGAVPVVGPLVAEWLRGGPEIGPNSLARFYTTHVLILPWAVLVLTAIHLWFLRRHGLKKGGAR
jgi:quinol-cytochrome oxidoreductase complex cytochrome b subunit